ncbi:MAG: hypothetical protein U0800_16665 [Isosphaeraceae bacterium]
MTDPFAWWSIHLGRWSGVRIQVHPTLVLFVALTLLGSMIDGQSSSRETAAWLGLYLIALAIHELAHAALARRLGEDPDDVRLGPMGNMSLLSHRDAHRTREAFWIALAGPAANLLIAITCLVALQFAGVRMVLNPFGNPADTHLGSGVPWAGDQPAAAFSAAWFVGWFGWLNLVLALINLLIPAVPLDCGRAVRALVAESSSITRDRIFALYLARASAIVLLVIFAIRLFQGRSGGWTLLGLAILIELVVRFEVRVMEEGGYQEEGGLFGYDFSEGYTSLESGAKVRPRRESALKRWRRRRSEMRRQRRIAQEAAEEQRMDEILDKLHREGRASLTDEEHRFLMRVSKRIKNKIR